MAERVQLFTGFKYNGFALIGQAMDALGLDLFDRVDSIACVDPKRKCLFPMPTHYLWNLRPSVDGDGYVFRLLEEGSQPFLMQDNMYLCLDGAGEGFPLDAIAFDHIAAKLKTMGLPPDRVLYLTSDLRAPQRYQEWCVKNEREPTFTPVPFDVQLYFYAGAMQASLPDLHDLYFRSWKSAVDGRVRPKKYLSFNLTPRPTRIGLALFLMYNNMIDAGHLSFHGRGIDNGPLDGAAWADDRIVHQWLKDLGLGDEIVASLPQLDAMSPISIDKDLDRYTMAYGGLQTNLYLDTYFSLVTETNFEHRAAEFRFTEKTWKPISHCHPFILFANPGSLAQLRAFGFQTFHPFIDEYYDTIDNPSLRFTYITEEIRRLLALNGEQLAELYSVLWPRVMHNFSLFHFGCRNLMRAEPLFSMLSD